MSGLVRAGQVFWTTVMGILAVTARLDGDIDRPLVARLGIDEHRFRTVRYLADETGRIKRVEPWSIVFTDLDTAATILDIVEGRRGAAVRRWLAARARWWRARVELAAIDISAQFRAAVRTGPPRAVITVDHFHVVARASQMITDVRRRRSQRLHGRRGRNCVPAYRYRKLLTCNRGNRSVAQPGRLAEIIEADLELGVVWGIKEHVRQLLRATDTAGFQWAWAELEHPVKTTRMPEAKSLFATLRAWRRPLLTCCAALGSPTPVARRRTRPRRASNASAAATLTTPTTAPGYCCTRLLGRPAKHLPPRSKWKSP